MTFLRPALAALVALLLSCDGATRPPGPAGATAEVRLKGRAIEVTLITAEKDRRGVATSLKPLEGARGYLVAWPRPRFAKLESEEARGSFDAAFLDAAGRVVDVQPLPRGREEGGVPEREAVYALLTAMGTLGVAVGDTVELSEAVKAASPKELPALTIGGQTARVELALTETERQHGLMHRPRMSAGDGMLFVYEGERQLGFWMKNTMIPLDIAFFRRDGTLVNVVETQMYADPRRPPPGHNTADSDGPAQLVLEMNLGWFRRNGIKPGMKAEFPPEAFKGFGE